MALRLVMMGTGEFALPAFLSLYDSPHHVLALFTQPDRVGRGHHRHVNVMKESALERNTPVFQPEKINTPEAITDLASLDPKPDLCVVAAYGQILSAEVIGIPRLGCINLHASLLPKYRGAAPVHYAIWNGESETGVTIFQIEPKLDAGLILGITRTPIRPKETTDQLTDRLADMAVPLLHRVLDQLESGTVRPLPQDTSLVTKAPRIQKSDGAIDWSRSSTEIERHIRAMQSWPKPFTYLNQSGRRQLRMLILDVEPASLNESDQDAPPGAVLCVNDKHLFVRTGDAVVELKTVQPAGKRAMSTAEFLRGHSIQPGDRFGPESL